MTRFVCLFHNADRARAAVEALQSSGIARESISVLSDEDRTAGYSGSESLATIGVPDRDLEHLQEGLRRGGVVVSLEAPERQSDAIERVFHKYSADKIDEAEVSVAPEAPIVAPVAAAAVAPVAAASTTEGTVVGEAVIPVSEESLVVGKREVDRGGVRVFRRTVETPVQQDVNLHSERVALEYREVNRPATEADLLAGTKEFAVVETAEVPVVQKVGRVVEEVHVGKVETDRTEVINDTVRHTEVEVEPIEPVDRTRVRE